MTQWEMPRLPGFERSDGDLRALLKNVGWHRAFGVEGEYEIWEEVEGGLSGGSILVPLNREAGDFSFRRAAAERAVREFVPATMLRLFGATTAIDQGKIATNWRKESETPAGSIPWLEGKSLYDSVSRQLIAAARATVGPPRAVLGRANETLVREFLERTVMGPSGVGSYIVTAITPVGVELQTKGDASVASARRGVQTATVDSLAVVEKFDSALSAVMEGLGQRGERDSVEAFKAGVTRGVSAELLSALADYARTTEGSVEIDARESGSRSEHVEYNFTPSQAYALSAGAIALRTPTQGQATEVRGIVRLVRREHGFNEGAVHVVDLSSGKARTIRMHLDGETYDSAVLAHMNGAFVSAFGSLVREGNFWWLRDVDTFQVEAPSSENDYDNNSLEI